jgi:transcriptional regulator with XRE-family HTH domain/tetratricopeptide (TPR) repeat protein
MADFGTELRLLMAVRGLGVRELARRVPCSPGYVSNLRNGTKKPSRATARRLDDLLSAGGSLLAAVTGRPVTRQPARHAPPDMPGRVAAFSAVEAGELICHLSAQWHALVKADNLLGPRHALEGVSSSLAVLDALLRTARGPVRESVLTVGARYAESAAWLHEDMADMAGARYWTRRAMEWATEGNDRHMVSWSLFRRSQQAAGGGDGAQVAGLAAAARREAGALPGPMLAAILQQEAHAHALDGDELACHRALDQAHQTAAPTDDPGDASAGHGSFCTPAYLEMQRGACWLTLGQPARAVTALETAIRSLPAAYRRDRGAALSRLAAAHAALGEPEAAVRAATGALGIARAAGSARVLKMTMAVADRLAAHAHADASARLRAAAGEIAGP